ncbi:uncharacterized protein MONOS_2177 [Monocercomonoides exilis]|uniref:uncharacterized protein n=1 Tax=Monocercomonoides exilis TaxID=2049356 RepID=UPI00355A40D9|nr:hypothetical protein MONOS_2177 [Monocercomonoides exilis]|eukprot:MONOS_2177.1-p1 / transcript=MONOS_2177.1 / gene=MONOS_2177 / organism=Monocercomonoides_exilis_PA203 / gene_product=unspecified product / transcript_product=unspecified product / location=Mono_scaffold00043:66862-70022(-) / protein_length=883 / sequence_SO=supercontig / SO=protein_coding / is_pseudo=false
MLKALHRTKSELLKGNWKVAHELARKADVFAHELDGERAISLVRGWVSLTDLLEDLDGDEESYEKRKISERASTRLWKKTDLWSFEKEIDEVKNMFSVYEHDNSLKAELKRNARVKKDVTQIFKELNDELDEEQSSASSSTSSTSSFSPLLSSSSSSSSSPQLLLSNHLDELQLQPRDSKNCNEINPSEILDKHQHWIRKSKMAWQFLNEAIKDATLGKNLSVLSVLYRLKIIIAGIVPQIAGGMFRSLFGSVLFNNRIFSTSTQLNEYRMMHKILSDAVMIQFGFFQSNRFLDASPPVQVADKRFEKSVFWPSPSSFESEHRFFPVFGDDLKRFPISAFPSHKEKKEHQYDLLMEDTSICLSPIQISIDHFNSLHATSTTSYFPSSYSPFSPFSSTPASNTFDPTPFISSSFTLNQFNNSLSAIASSSSISSSGNQPFLSPSFDSEPLSDKSSKLADNLNDDFLSVQSKHTNLNIDPFLFSSGFPNQVAYRIVEMNFEPFFASIRETLEQQFTTAFFPLLTQFYAPFSYLLYGPSSVSSLPLKVIPVPPPLSFFTKRYCEAHRLQKSLNDALDDISPETNISHRFSASKSILRLLSNGVVTLTSVHSLVHTPTSLSALCFHSLRVAHFLFLSGATQHSLRWAAFSMAFALELRFDSFAAASLLLSCRCLLFMNRPKNALRLIQYPLYFPLLLRGLSDVCDFKQQETKAMFDKENILKGKTTTHSYFDVNHHLYCRCEHPSHPSSLVYLRTQLLIIQCLNREADTKSKKTEIMEKLNALAVLCESLDIFLESEEENENQQNDCNKHQPITNEQDVEQKTVFKEGCVDELMLLKCERNQCKLLWKDINSEIARVANSLNLEDQRNQAAQNVLTTKLDQLGNFV